MLLPPNEAKYFSYYTHDSIQDVDKYFDIFFYDDVKVTFKRKYDIKVFTFTRTWTKKYRFRRYLNSNNKWAALASFDTFIKQLNKLESGNWNYVDYEIYEKLKIITQSIFYRRTKNGKWTCDRKWRQILVLK